MKIFITNRDKIISKHGSEFYDFRKYWGNIIIISKGKYKNKIQFISPSGRRCHMFDNETFERLKNSIPNIKTIYEGRDKNNKKIRRFENCPVDVVYFQESE